MKPDVDPISMNGDLWDVEYLNGKWALVSQPNPNFKVMTLDLSIPWQRYVVFSYGAQPKTLATGAQQGLHGAFTGEFNVETALRQVDPTRRPYDLPFDHGAEFAGLNSNRAPYWSALFNYFGL